MQEKDLFLPIKSYFEQYGYVCDGEVGGINKTKLITGYREEALLVLDALVGLGGQATTRSIRENSGISKTTTILYNNYYGWFYNIKKGTYGVTEAGLTALKEYQDTMEKLKEKKSEICVKNEDADKVRKMKSDNRSSISQK